MDTPRSVQDVTPLREDRVEFAPLQMENIHTHFRWNNDPELNRLDSEIPYKKEKFGEFKSRFEQMCENPAPSRRTFEIHAREDGKLIGVAYAVRISPHNRHAHVGITIGDREYWGQGYGRASFELLLSYCFDELELHRVSAETFEYHTAWRDLIEGLDFRKEGTTREYLYRDGKYWDKEIYGLLEREYRARREEGEETVSMEMAA